jgi:hypothetical protein
LKAAAEPST